MAFGHGKNAYFAVDDSGDVLRNLTTYLTEAGLPRSVDTAEVSTLGSSAKGYVAGLSDATIPIGGPWDATVDSYLAGILGLEKDFEYGPAGNTGGYVKYMGRAILTSYEISTAVDDAQTFTGEFQVTGAISRTTF